LYTLGISNEVIGCLYYTSKLKTEVNGKHKRHEKKKHDFACMTEVGPNVSTASLGMEPLDV